MSDHMGVLCADYREELSARLDGEDDPRVRAEVDAHLESCGACQVWVDDAARVTRLARTGLAQATPDLVEAVRAQAPAVRRGWPRLVLRAVLALAGVGEVLLAVAQLVGDAHRGAGGAMDGASMLHFAHESAAWNLALGVAFLWVAWQVRRAPGLVPLLTAFVLVLSALTGIDFAAGHVDVTRLFTHGLVLVGYVAVLALTARRFGGGGFFPHARRGVWHAAESGVDAETAVAGVRSADGGGGTDLRPTARRHAA